ncbi:hypothetical protein FRACA_140001 [Frankia canadensis]|uniref:Uncharacterized protein n=1 Tax=Frankia canadensis TaxID=1836972 RepID=A0A2I2KL50_9ACTN|nr:hypothetical protein FRACA_140001 [Frankia canadensis]SOU53692.1 hypothetical protein FRACA_140001 [Frankia canadensis]
MLVVDGFVVSAAEQEQVFDVGGSSLFPADGVVGLEPSGALAAGVAAVSAVAEVDGVAEAVGGEASSSAEVQRVAVLVGVEVAEVGVAAEAFEDGGG